MMSIKRDTPWGAIIDGTECGTDTADTFEVTNPATGEVIGSVISADADLVDRAVQSSRAAFEDWKLRAPRERAGLVREAAARIKASVDELADLEVLEVGKPRHIAVGDVNACINTYNMYAGAYHLLHGEIAEHGVISTRVTHDPYGVVAGILPFNWPPNHYGRKTAPPLVAGNTVVIKPGEQAPITALRITQIVNEVLPPGVVNAVPGLAAGPALVAHQLVERISFTGASATGMNVLKTAAEHFAYTTTELGGKNALLVLDDADLEVAVAVAVEGMYYNSGEACTSTSRILVHDSIYAPFLERFVAASTALVVGDGMDERTQIGPMVDARHRDKVLSYIAIAVKEGARIHAQGQTPTEPRLQAGYWVPATVLVDFAPDSTVGQEEIFGPVASVMRFGDDDEAVRIANGTRYGLNAAVCSRDTIRALALAERLEAGSVYINNYFRRGSSGVPFGGVKASGFGRESSVDALLDFTRTKSVRLPSGRGPVPSWPPRG